MREEEGGGFQGWPCKIINKSDKYFFLPIFIGCFFIVFTFLFSIFSSYAVHLFFVNGIKNMLNCYLER